MSIRKFKYKDKCVTMDDANSQYYSGNYERSNFYENDFLEYVSSLKLGGVYLDIGTNIANHAVFFGLFSGANEVQGFEPIDEYRNIAIGNINRNGLEDKVTLFDDALGEKEKSTLISIDGKSQRVNVMKLDDHEVSKQEISLIKVDVEGMEPDVLKGAMNTINRNRPILFLEVIQDEDSNNYFYDDLKDILNGLNYVPTGRAFNFQPTLEFVPREKLQKHTETVGRQVISFDNLQHTNSNATKEIASGGEIFLSVPPSEASWFSWDLSDFNMCNSVGDFNLKKARSVFLEAEASHNAEAKFFVAVNLYNDGKVFSQTKKYVNRRVFAPIPDVENADQLRVFLYVENGDVALRKFAFTYFD